MSVQFKEPLEETAVMQTLNVPVAEECRVKVAAGKQTLTGNLFLHPEARGVVLFVQGCGMSRHCPRNTFLSNHLNCVSVATVLIDLLTREEEAVDLQTATFRFDISLLACRLRQVTQWIKNDRRTRDLAVGYFATGSAAAAAVIAATRCDDQVAAIVSRSGRPDLAGETLSKLRAPTLLIVGSADEVVVDLNRKTLGELRCEKKLTIVPGASHLFTEAGTLAQVARHAHEWFERWFSTSGSYDLAANREAAANNAPGMSLN